jgi:hypothetical protein
VTVHSVECLTESSKSEQTEPKLKARYYFDGKQIDNLWKVGVTLRNDSSETLVGKGELKKIIDEHGLVFQLRNGLQIIDAKKYYQDFNHSLIIQSNKRILITFWQWRANEKITYFFYIRTEERRPIIKGIFKEPKVRPIIDWDTVFVIDEDKVNESDGKEKYESLLKMWGSLMVLFFIALFGGFWAYAMLLRPFCFFKIKMWKSKNYERYQKFLLQKYGGTAKQYARLLNDPVKMDEDMWEGFDGEKYPEVNKGVEFDQKWYQVFFPEFLLLFLVVFHILIFLYLLQELF